MLLWRMGGVIRAGRGVHDDLKALWSLRRRGLHAVLGTDVEGGVLRHLSARKGAEFFARVGAEKDIVAGQCRSAGDGGKAVHIGGKAARCDAAFRDSGSQISAEHPFAERAGIAVVEHGVHRGQAIGSLNDFGLSVFAGH